MFLIWLPFGSHLTHDTDAAGRCLQAKAEFLQQKATTETEAPVNTVTIRLLNPAQHLPHACYYSFVKFVKSHEGEELPSAICAAFHW